MKLIKLLAALAAFAFMLGACSDDESSVADSSVDTGDEGEADADGESDSEGEGAEGDAAALTQALIDQDVPEESAACVAEGLVDKVDQDIIETMLEAAESGEDPEGEPPAELMTAMTELMTECADAMLEDAAEEVGVDVEDIPLDEEDVSEIIEEEMDSYTEETEPAE